MPSVDANATIQKTLEGRWYTRSPRLQYPEVLEVERPLPVRPRLMPGEDTWYTQRPRRE